MHFQILDKLRIKKAEKRVSEQSHEARKTKKLKVIKDNENMRMKEGDVYVPGAWGCVHDFVFSPSVYLGIRCLSYGVHGTSSADLEASCHDLSRKTRGFFLLRPN
ncbi:hypothetical protein NPIL_38281 [Nephila pilipes]|uniref:Uncharacterized protein n=1 Tax=Nephila pilipes TaxID=299642 RepID=A0A8X6QUR7_NEPPI|nr:hypothetical protein NPIL_38281 [Nephila pilipes]